MNTLPSIQKVFLDHLELLDKLYECGQKHYGVIQEKLSFFKALSLPLIGTPLSHLLNEQIKQNYLIIQHIDNCQVYKTVLEDKAMLDDDLHKQLSGLIQITLELKKEEEGLIQSYYKFLTEELRYRKIEKVKYF